MEIIRFLLLLVSSGTCYDRISKCPELGQDGYCDSDPAYMVRYCQKTCGTCGSGERMMLNKLVDLKCCNYNHEY